MKKSILPSIVSKRADNDLDSVQAWINANETFRMTRAGDGFRNNASISRMEMHAGDQ